MSTTLPPSVPALSLPLTLSERQLIEQAASLAGQSLDQFARAAMLDRARELVQPEDVRVLSQRDALRFLELLDADEAPNEALRRAAARYTNCHD